MALFDFDIPRLLFVESLQVSCQKKAKLITTYENKKVNQHQSREQQEFLRRLYIRELRFNQKKMGRKARAVKTNHGTSSFSMDCRYGLLYLIS